MFLLLLITNTHLTVKALTKLSTKSGTNSNRYDGSSTGSKQTSVRYPILLLREFVHDGYSYCTSVRSKTQFKVVSILELLLDPSICRHTIGSVQHKTSWKQNWSPRDGPQTHSAKRCTWVQNTLINVPFIIRREALTRRSRAHFLWQDTGVKKDRSSCLRVFFCRFPGTRHGPDSASLLCTKRTSSLRDTAYK